MFISAEESKLLDNIYFEELINILSFDFEQLIILRELLNGYKAKEIKELFGISERAFFKRKKKMQNQKVYDYLKESVKW